MLETSFLFYFLSALFGFGNLYLYICNVSLLSKISFIISLRWLSLIFSFASFFCLPIMEPNANANIIEPAKYSMKIVLPIVCLFGGIRLKCDIISFRFIFEYITLLSIAVNIRTIGTPNSIISGLFSFIINPSGNKPNTSSMAVQFVCNCIIIRSVMMLIMSVTTTVYIPVKKGMWSSFFHFI